MSGEDVIRVDDNVTVWLDNGGGITIRAVTPEGDPVELSSRRARQLADALVDLADRDDGD